MSERSQAATLDPATIMAAHRGVGTDNYCVECDWSDHRGRCLPYRLAKQAQTYERLAAINFNTCARMESERDEACEAIQRVEAFLEQIENGTAWLGVWWAPADVIAARIRAELKPRKAAA